MGRYSSYCSCVVLGKKTCSRSADKNLRVADGYILYSVIVITICSRGSFICEIYNFEYTFDLDAPKIFPKKNISGVGMRESANTIIENAVLFCKPGYY